MSIRAFNLDDFEEIEAIYNLSKLDELRYESKTFELLPLMKDEPRLKSLMESQIFVYEEGRILGYGACHGSEIRALFVHPSSRGFGIGSKLLGCMLQLVGRPTTLYVAKTNEPAKLLYSRYGFQVTDEFVTSYNGISVFANKMVSSVGCG